MKHPDIKFVESIVNSLLLKRRYTEWTLTNVQYSHFPSNYLVTFTKGTEKKTVSLVTEFFDEISVNDTPLTRRRIKNLIKQAIAPNEPDDE